ncbi:MULTISPECIES: hypothetical protein [Rhodopseudomonas]|nr:MULTISPECIES: hypothetical protein [Rhodopseudomonas]MDF3810504.1 hypothetical protein [Rhodopseudomonas sp. BAL398]WOK20239.1 hypothetical protein RBJ75_12275 [Rhodopseudomonas sp. BAL398]
MSSISSVTSSPPPKPVKATEPQRPAVKADTADKDADKVKDASRTPPAQPAPLPPGQGTRVNIFA